jgi:hypothetical protein
MNDESNDKLFIVKVKTTDTNTDEVWYDYESVYANDAEQALYIWNEEMIETDTRHLDVIAVEVFSTQSVMIIDDENIDEEHSDE